MRGSGVSTLVRRVEGAQVGMVSFNARLARHLGVAAYFALPTWVTCCWKQTRISQMTSIRGGAKTQ